jgi:hypothetical protein
MVLALPPVAEDRLFLLNWLEPLRGKLCLEAITSLAAARQALANWGALEDRTRELVRTDVPSELEQPIGRVFYEVRVDMLARWGLLVWNTVPPIDSHQALKTWCDVLQMALTVPDSRWEAEIEGQPAAALDIAFPLLVEAIRSLHPDRAGELPPGWDRGRWHELLGGVRWYRLREPRFFLSESDFLSMTEGMWGCMRRLGGHHRPPEPCRVPDARAARNVLDVVAWWCEEHQESAEPRRQGTPSSAPEPDGQGDDGPKKRYRFRKDGEIWNLEYEGESGQYQSLAGLNYIARLLGQVHKEVNALDLYGSPDRVKADRHTVQPIADEQALAGLNRRLQAIEEGIVEAREENDQTMLSVHEREKAEVLAEVRKATAGHGHPRQLGPAAPGRKAADTVRKSIDNALKKIEPAMPRLCGHLRSSIQRSNASFAYRPPTPAPAWEL